MLSHNYGESQFLEHKGAKFAPAYLPVDEVAKRIKDTSEQLDFYLEDYDPLCEMIVIFNHSGELPKEHRITCSCYRLKLKQPWRN